MISTTQIVIVGIIIFLLFGAAIFKRMFRQVVEAKKEVNKTVKEWENAEEEKPHHP